MKVSENTPILSVIVPVAPGDEAWRDLLHDLRELPTGTEILFSGPAVPFDFQEAALTNGAQHVRWLTTGVGRAVQQNNGSTHAKGRYLWFLHADSRISPVVIKNLFRALESNDCRFYYFNLHYLNDGPVMVALNAIGAWIRSHILSIPFGDQGFCIRRDVFHKLGCFDETCLYGEDHLFVWSARRSSIRLCCVRGGLATSARKYRDNGWLRTTLNHFVLTVLQAVPEFGKLMKERLSSWQAAPLPHLSKRPDYPQ